MLLSACAFPRFLDPTQQNVQKQKKQRLDFAVHFFRVQQRNLATLGVLEIARQSQGCVRSLLKGDLFAPLPLPRLTSEDSAMAAS